MAAADTYRILSYNTGMSRPGPGLLVRDLFKAPTPEIARIAEIAPDIAVLQNVDWDLDQVVIGLIQDHLEAAGHPMVHAYAPQPNTGLDTGFDIDRNGRFGEPRDMQGYAEFTGQAGIVVLSRFPIDHVGSRNFSELLWQDTDFARPEAYYSDAELAVLRLHSIAAWDVAIATPKGTLRLLTSYANTPVFDGPEDRNGFRNAAELEFWVAYLDTLESTAFVYAGDLNADLDRGEGQRAPLRALLSHPNLQDPLPGITTVDWPTEGGPGPMRVDYVLPSAEFQVAGGQVDRRPLDPDGTRHHPVWIDILWE